MVEVEGQLTFFKVIREDLIQKRKFLLEELDRVEQDIAWVSSGQATEVGQLPIPNLEPMSTYKVLKTAFEIWQDREDRRLTSSGI